MKCAIVVVGDVTKKWSHMRTQFMKELARTKKPGKSGTASRATTKWRFFSAMSFLQACLPATSARATNLEVYHCYRLSGYTDNIKKQYFYNIYAMQLVISN